MQKTKVDWQDKESVKAYNAARMRAWRKNNSEKYLEGQLRQVQRRLERLRAKKDAPTERPESEGREA